MRLTKTTNGAVMLDAAAFPDRAQETLNREMNAFPPFREVVQRLAEHEDLEEAGRLVKLPCKVGDAVFVVERDEIKVYTVNHFNIIENGVYVYLVISYSEKSIVSMDDFGETVFFTREEAEAALKGEGK